MDKVIIDGVDVSGCCCYEIGKCLWTKRYYENNIVPDCEKVKNCYYKQLRRLQAEYDDLHLSYAGCKTANTGLQELNKNLEEENKILNNMLKVNDSTKYDYYKFIKENEQLKKSIDRLMKNKEIKTIDLDIAKENAELKAENEKLKSDFDKCMDANKYHFDKWCKCEQALQEIRKICKNSHTSASEDFYRTADKIQAKINEVIGAE